MPFAKCGVTKEEKKKTLLKYQKFKKKKPKLRVLRKMLCRMIFMCRKAFNFFYFILKVKMNLNTFEFFCIFWGFFSEKYATGFFWVSLEKNQQNSKPSLSKQNSIKFFVTIFYWFFFILNTYKYILKKNSSATNDIKINNQTFLPQFECLCWFIKLAFF